jgi:hypothetical protein
MYTYIIIYIYIYEYYIPIITSLLLLKFPERQSWDDPPVVGIPSHEMVKWKGIPDMEGLSNNGWVIFRYI